MHSRSPFHTSCHTIHSSQPAAPITNLSTHFSAPPPCAQLPTPRLDSPMPLAMKSPAPRSVVPAVVLAVFSAGALESVLVLPFTTTAVPPGRREYVVPSITT